MNLNKIKRFVNDHKKELIFGIASISSISIGVIAYNIGIKQGINMSAWYILGIKENQKICIDSHIAETEMIKLDVDYACSELSEICEKFIKAQIEKNPKNFAFAISANY